MRFSDYLRANPKYRFEHILKTYGEGDYYLCYGELAESTGEYPASIRLFPVLEYRTPLKVVCLASNVKIVEATYDNFDNDKNNIVALIEQRIKPNEKNIAALEKKLNSMSESSKEYDGCKQRLWNEKHVAERMINTVYEQEKDDYANLMAVTRHFANNGKVGTLAPNAPLRWNNIIRKLGYDGFMFEGNIHVLHCNAYKVVDEI